MNQPFLLAIALGAAAVVAACVPAAAQTPPSAPRPLPPPPRASVDAALVAPLARYSRHYKGGAHNSFGANGGAPVVLSLAALTAPPGDTRADARLLEQMRYTIQGGNEITANGGYPAQHERYVTAMYALARQTPRIWKQLTSDEVARVDLLMTAALVASAFTTSDNNPYLLAKKQQYTLDGDDNLGRDWNPNYREGMVGMLLVAPVYFGGTEKAEAILDGYDHAAFCRALEQHGLSNLHETFTWRAAHPDSPAPTGAMIEAAIRRFRYKGISLRDPMAIFTLLTLDTYGKTVQCGLNDGQGVALPDGTRAGMLPSGCESLPNVGKPGMLKEFDSVDAGGPRSSASYSYDGFRINLVNHLVLIAGGLWRPGEAADTCLSRMRVGIPDLWYKIEHGYVSYAKGKSQGTLRADSANHGFVFSRPLWEAVVKPYHETAK